MIHSTQQLDSGRPLILMTPNEVGLGHRIRLRRIAEELSKNSSSPRIAFILSKPPYDWLTFERIMGWPRQTLGLLTADILVEDGRLLTDFLNPAFPATHVRRRAFCARGGKIVTIMAPAGELPKNVWAYYRRTLPYTSLVIVPWPEGFLPFSDKFGVESDRIRWIPPVMNVPEDGLERTKDIQPIVLVSARHSEDLINAQVQRALRSLRLDKELQVVGSAQFKDHRSNREYYQTFMRSTLVFTQGTSTAFEACYLGIPQVFVPVLEEHFRVAARMEELGICKAFPLRRMETAEFRAHLRRVLENSGLRRQMESRGEALVRVNGASEAARLVSAVME